MIRFGGRLFVVILYFLISALPLGAIVMGVSCRGKNDWLDWILALFVPLYGFVEAFLCR